METITIDYLGEKFKELQTADAGGALNSIREEGFNRFNKTGLPSFKNEEWKYTFISNLFKKEYHFSEGEKESSFSKLEIDAARLPGSETATELFFVNGRYVPSLSTIRSSEKQLIILPLEEAAKSEYKDLVNEHLNKIIALSATIM